MTDGVVTIKTMNNHSIHTERTRPKSHVAMVITNFQTELMNMDMHSLNAHRLPKRPVLGILAYSELAWRSKHETFRF